jgi:hypothetical protein
VFIAVKKDSNHAPSTTHQACAKTASDGIMIGADRDPWLGLQEIQQIELG